MAVRGSCLCGAFAFEVQRFSGPFEICHCARCRKKSGSNGIAMIGVDAAHYRVTSDAGAISSYEAPILNQPPPYHSYFCSKCGSPLPPPNPSGWFEIPAGLLDDDPAIRPDKHIYVELAAPWDLPGDDLPRFTVRDLAQKRHNIELPPNHEIRTHHGESIRV